MERLGGIEAMTGIRDEFPDARIIVLSTYAGAVQALRALRAGARGYLLKRHVHTDLLGTIRAVHAGQKRVPTEVAAELAGYAGADELTPREIEILRLIAGGNANKEIGARLAICGGDCEEPHYEMLSKLEANDRTHVVTIGLKRGIIGLQRSPKSRTTYRHF